LFVTEPPTPFQCYQWSQAAHERALQEAGFRTCTWYPSEVSPEDLAQYGEAYWQDLRENCLVIGLVCQKGPRAPSRPPLRGRCEEKSLIKLSQGGLAGKVSHCRYPRAYARGTWELKPKLQL